MKSQISTGTAVVIIVVVVAIIAAIAYFAVFKKAPKADAPEQDTTKMGAEPPMPGDAGYVEGGAGGAASPAQEGQSTESVMPGQK